MQVVFCSDSPSRCHPSSRQQKSSPPASPTDILGQSHAVPQPIPSDLAGKQTHKSPSFVFCPEATVSAPPDKGLSSKNRVLGEATRSLESVPPAFAAFGSRQGFTVVLHLTSELGGFTLRLLFHILRPTTSSEADIFPQQLNSPLPQLRVPQPDSGSRAHRTAK